MVVVMRGKERIRVQILRMLLEGEKTFYDIVHRQDSCLPETFALLSEMEKEGLIGIDSGKIKLTAEGMAFCKENNIKELGNVLCEACEATGIVIRDEFKKILEEYKKIAMNRPKAVEKYDQGFISLEGVVKRVAFMYERGELSNAEIFVGGDDDLLSIVLALTGLPKRVVAVDIDERLINIINKTAKERGLPLEAFTHDLRYEFSDDIKKKFDVFVTDPVETVPGIRLFLSRCVSTLKGIGCSGYFGLTTVESSRKKWYEIERILLDMGFVITDIKRKFNVYPFEEESHGGFEETFKIVKKLGQKANCDWYYSTLIRIEAVKEPKPLIEGTVELGPELYVDEETWATPE
jgi:hypothetical protein